MKKLLFFFLLAPLAVFSQTEIGQEWVNLPQNVKVGDTITYQQYILDLSGTNYGYRLVQTDIAYNNKKLVKVGEPVWNTDWNSYSKAVNHWVNYSYDPTVLGTDANDLDAQFSEGLGQKYNSQNDWNIQRHTLQTTGPVTGVLFTQQFKIVDVSTSNYTDYTDAVRLNWAYVKDATQADVVDVYGNPQKLDISSVGGTPAGTITFQLQTPNAVNGTDYMIVVEPLELYQAYQNTTDPSTIDYSQYPPQVQGDLNAAGQFVTTGLLKGIPYIFNVFVKSTYDQATQTSTHPQWLDDVVTVSDVMQVFKQAIGTNPDGTGNVFQYNIQKQLANVKRNGPNDPVDFGDSYVLLAHIAGVLANGVNDPNVQEFYPITSFNNGSFNYSGWFDNFGQTFDSQEAWLAQRQFTINDDQPVTFNVGHGLMGDADLSHSTTPNLNANTQISAMAFSRARRPQNIMKAVAQETIDLDVVSQLVNGKVVVEINLTKADLAGMQFNINYDKSTLTFDDITFDTGNTMTNFAKHFDDGRINFGTINIESENIKTGKPFKLIFTPKVSIQNTVGLVNFRVTDAVKHNGTKVNLNIQ